MRDAAGMFVSGLCLAHCLLTPVLLALGGFGVLGALLEDRLVHLVHLVLLLPVLLLALFSFPGACRRHRRPAVMFVGFSGLLLLVVALCLEGTWELLASTAGAGLLVAAHWVNRRMLNRRAVAETGEICN